MHLVKLLFINQVSFLFKNMSQYIFILSWKGKKIFFTIASIADENGMRPFLYFQSDSYNHLDNCMKTLATLYSLGVARI